MAKKAAAVKQWIGNRKRFANLFNAKIFGGVQIIKPEDLEPIEGETHILIQTKDRKRQEIHRYRDIAMRWKGKMDFMILACENQDKIHYAMPVRTMLYDGLSYVQQMKVMWDLRDETDEMTNDEFLSKFCKDDKIYPVITLVFYFGEKEWDASLDLYGMRNQDEGGRVDMCKAMEDWAADERAEGKLEGEENKLVDLIRKKLVKGKDISIIADEVEETEEVVRKLMEKHKLKA